MLLQGLPLLSGAAALRLLLLMQLLLLLLLLQLLRSVLLHLRRRRCEGSRRLAGLQFGLAAREQGAKGALQLGVFNVFLASRAQRRYGRGDTSA